MRGRTTLAGAVAGATLALVGAAPAHAICELSLHKRPKQRVSSPPPLVIGASVLMAAHAPLTRSGFEVDGKVCRRMSDGLDILRERRRARRMPPVVVIALGANLPLREEELDAALEIVGPGTLVAYAMPREAEGRAGPNARLIRAFARRHPERVRALDWIAYAHGRSGWFASDDLHLTRPGGRAMGRLIARVLGPHAVRARMAGSGDAVSIAGRTLPLALVGVELPPPDACGGPQARDLLLRLAFTAPSDGDGDGLAERPGGRGRTVTLRLEPLRGLVDRAGRLRAHVTAVADRAFAPALLEAGLARVHGRGFRGHDRFEAAETRARAARRGIWACG